MNHRDLRTGCLHLGNLFCSGYLFSSGHILLFSRSTTVLPEYAVCPKYTPVLCRMHRFFDQQRHFPCDTATGKPAGIRQIIVHHLHTHLILLFPEERLRTDIIRKRHISVWSFSQIITVTEDLAVLIHPVEAESDPLATVYLRQPETHPVPSGPTLQISCPAGIGPGKGRFHRPVMGHRHRPPAVIVISLIPGLLALSQMKAPVLF